MDSSRFWNSVRSLEDWERTRDLWDRGRIEAYEAHPGAYTYARGDGTGLVPAVEDAPLRPRDAVARARRRPVRLRRRAVGRAVVQEGLAAARRERARGRGGRRRVARRRAGRHVVAERDDGDLRGGRRPPPRARRAAAGARGDRARRPGLGVLDARRREGRRLGVGRQLAARSGRKAARCRPIPSSGGCGRRSGARTSSGCRRRTGARWCPARGGWRCTPADAGARRPVPARPRDWRPRRAGAARRARLRAQPGRRRHRGPGGALFVTSPAPPAEAEATLPDLAAPMLVAGGPRRRTARTRCRSRRTSRRARPPRRVLVRASDAGVARLDLGERRTCVRLRRVGSSLRSPGHRSRSLEVGSPSRSRTHLRFLQPRTTRPSRPDLAATGVLVPGQAQRARAPDAGDHRARHVRHARGRPDPRRAAGVPARQPLEPGHLGRSRSTATRRR